MNEKLLQFIWQHKYFNLTSLVTQAGEELSIVTAGQLNTNEGPDFLNASIKINNISLYGSIELHLKTSHFTVHGHYANKQYGNIILHVVWQNDVAAGSPLLQMPTLVLEPYVKTMLLHNYQQLMQHNTKVLPCATQLPALSAMAWKAYKERLVAERLQEKATYILQQLTYNYNNWEQTFWQILAYNFGLKLNAQLFEAVAKSVSVQLLAKHKNSLIQLEALLLGQANLLNAPNFNNSYASMLQKEYNFLKHKHGLVAVSCPPVFLRMRPANFPTLRLAQLASVIYNNSHLFSIIKTTTAVTDLVKFFTTTVNDYWQRHYTLTDEESNEVKNKDLGKSTIYSLLINTVVPIMYAYGQYNNHEAYKQKALEWLYDIAAEKNTKTAMFTNVDLPNQSAFDSQAYVQLYNHYCLQKLCLQCSVGHKILGKQ